MAEMVVRSRIVQDFDKCSGCGECAELCPVGIWKIRDVKIDGGYRRKSVMVGDQKDCMGCRLCETYCQEKAIQIIEEEV